jgi:hypothetical protein
MKYPKTQQQVIDILTNICNLNITEPCYNERYLHHYFTEKVQKVYPIVYDNLSQSKLHPEWTTIGKYRKESKEYIITEKGTCGHIDFAIGDYNNPDLGIEFKHTTSWNYQSLIFDFMKLLDIKNKIKSAISFSIIYRENELSNRLTLNKINETIEIFTNRLDNRLEKDRPFLFWIIEVAPKSKTNQKKSWFCNSLDEKFKELNEKNLIKW